MKQFLEAGKIVNSHGIRGELKIQPWCDSAEFLTGIDTLYIDGKPMKVISSRVHKNCVLSVIEGINSINDAEKYINKIVYINRDDAIIDEDSYFIQDLIGLCVYDLRLKREIGRVKEILNMPASDVYVISAEDGEEIMIPSVEEFVKEIDLEKELITVETIEGMYGNED